MLLTTAPTVSVTPTINSGLSSLNEDIMDENPNKLITYLHQLAGSYEIEVDVIMQDHCYARPWNWKPENVYVRPVKNLFFSKTHNTINKRDSVKQEEFINVEDEDPEPITPPYDLMKIRQAMDEFQRVANFVRSEDTDDWEEKIDKILWSPVQNRIFSRTVRILNSERVARLAKVNSLYEPILRRSSIDMTSKRFRETLASANWDWRISQWLHSLLFDYLPQEYLAIYLDILQTLRQKVPQLIDKMIAIQPNINSKGSSVTWETLGPLLKKSWDPVGPVLNANRPKKLPGNPILVIIPNGISSFMSSRQHKWIAQLGTLGMVVTVNPHLGLTANKMTVIAGIEQLIQACRAKIQDVRVDFPGRPIILVGFKTGAGLACQIGQLEHVTAIVCLGFPFNTVDGKRGAPDDTLLDVRCPVMFVIGQNSMLARVDDIEDLRERMLVPTSLVVVGSADDYLRIPTSKKISEKISQSMVDRCVLDEIGDFVGGILLQPYPLPLRSPNSINNCESRGKRGDGRKRKNSTSSSVESEPHSPNLKKLRSHSPQALVTGNNIAGIQTNILPRGTLVTLTGTTSTQTPRKKSRTSFINQNFSDQLITSRLTTQQPNLDSSTGGITLNIGSFASLAPVGPIRFEPTSISLQGSAGNKNNSTLKASNAFIKVSKNNQMNITGTQNVAKIKMIMPTKKISQRTIGNNYKNININDKTINMNMVNVLTPTNTPLRINTSPKTVTNIKATTGNINVSPLPSIHTSKNTVNASGTLIGKPISSSSILFTPQNSFTATSTTTPTSPTKESDISVTGGNRKPTMFCSYTEDQSPKTSIAISPSSITSLSEISKMRLSKSQPMSKISLRSLPKSSPQSVVQNSEKNLKICTGSNNTALEYTPISNTNLKSDIDDDLGNILDIPIIIAKDGENLNNFDRLPILPQTGMTLHSNGKSLPIINTVGNKLVFINNRNTAATSEAQQTQALNQVISTRTKNSVMLNRGILKTSTQPTIKYTKIILTKRNDQEDKSSPVILTKTNKNANKLLVIDSNSDIKYAQGTMKIMDNYTEKIQNSVKSENLNVTDQQFNASNLNTKPTFIELNLENSKTS